MDRISTNETYVVLNTRIIHVGLNCTKRKCNDDRVHVPELTGKRNA